MRVVFVFVVTLLIFGCSSTANKPQPSGVDSAFREANRLSCKIRFGDNPKYCSCFVNVMSEIAPQSMKNRALSGDPSVSSDLAKLMLDHSDRMNQCELLRIEDLAIPEIKLPKLAREILSSNLNGLLTPDNRVKLKPIREIGYEFSFEPVESEKKGRYLKRLTNVEGDAYYFSTLKDGTIEKADFYKYENGIEYYHKYKEPGNKYLVWPDRLCYFVIGECKFVSTSGRPKKMFTEFKDGVWISNEPGFGASRKVVLRIYGNDGLPLYEYILLKNGRSLEYSRYSPSK